MKLGISYELSAKQTIHMKYKALFSLEKQQQQNNLEYVNCLMLKDVKLNENFYPLNLISMLKSKNSFSIFTPST